MRATFYACISGLCITLLGTAVWLQLHDYPPCPLCILQRIAYLLIALSCLIAIIGPVRIFFHGFALISTITGLGIASRHVWVLYHPTISCSIDPLETALNQLPLARWVPWLFKADGLCSLPLPPILGLEIPVWSLVWFVVLVAVLGVSFWRIFHRT